jgi:hypothetical protein
VLRCLTVWLTWGSDPQCRPAARAR